MRSHHILGYATAALLSLVLCVAAGSAQQKNQVDKTMEHQAKGTFEVKMAPQKPDNPQAEKSGVGRMSIDKQFHGDLEATSQGEMLGFMTEVKGSAGYVAMERVTGKLQGRSGSFVLQHNGTMIKGAPQMKVVVVPDSGTGELTGISGQMVVTIADGKHSYVFDYSLQ